MTAPPGEGSGGDRSGDSGLPPARSLRPARPLTRPDPTQSPPPADPPPPPVVPVDDPPREDPDPARTVVGPDGERWVVEVGGRGRTGTPPDRGAPLLLLRFRPEGEQPVGEGAVRERLVVAASLSALSEPDLLTALAAATRPPPPR